MTQELNAAFIRVLHPNGGALGVGFLVGDRLVLTCAHVLSPLLIDSAISPTIPSNEVLLDFPLLPNKPKCSAQIVLNDSAADIAGLELVGETPSGSRPLRLITSDDLWNHNFRVFGVTAGFMNGVWASGRIMEMEATGWLQIEDTHHTGYFVQPGFSGGPVWDEQLAGVVGMVVAADTTPGVRAAFAIPSASLVESWPALKERAIPICPYRGLFAFREQDAFVFFGRETFTAKLVEVVKHQSLTAIIGASGSGKSSVIFAGLLPHLHTDPTWIISDFRPGKDPFLSMASALAPWLEPGMSEIDCIVEVHKLATVLQKQEVPLSLVIERYLRKNPSKERFLLVVDQFEELYTQCPDATLRQAFIDTLLDAIQPGGALAILVTLRADFLGQALALRSFADALQNADLKLGPMNRDELCSVIEQPARTCKVTFESGLVERLLDDVADQPGHLPLLEFALTLLWELQSGGKLTHAAYDTIGHVEGALACYADRVVDSLHISEQEQAHRIFVQLVTPGAGTEDTRRLASRTDLGEEDWVLVKRLADARLVITDQTPVIGEIVEIVHEALIRNWERLSVWMEADRTFRSWQERLRTALRQWQSSGQDEGALLHGAPLAEAESWLEHRGTELSQAERDYIQAGLTLRDREQKERQAQQQRELAQAQRLAKTQRQRTAVLAIGLFIASVLILTTLYLNSQVGRNLQRAQQNASTAIAEADKRSTAEALAQDERDNAIEQARLNRISQLAAQAQAVANEYPSRSLLLAMESMNFNGENKYSSNLTAQQALHQALSISGGLPINESNSGTESIAFSPDGHWLATGSADNTVRVWDLLDLSLPPISIADYAGEVNSTIQEVIFSGDGKWFISSNDNGLISLRDPNYLSKNPIKVMGNRPVLDDESDLLAAWGNNGEYIYIYDLKNLRMASEANITLDWANDCDGRRLYTPVLDVNNRWVAVSCDNNVILYDLSGEHQNKVILEDTDEYNFINHISISKDGKWLATGGKDATGFDGHASSISLWKLDTGNPSENPLILNRHRSGIYALAFSPDGKWLASCSSGIDKSIRLSDLTVDDPSTNTILISNFENSVTEVNITGGNLLEMSFSSDSHWLVAVNGKDLLIYDLTMPDPIARSFTLRGHEQNIDVIALSSDGRWLASGNDKEVVRLWDLRRPDSSADPVVLQIFDTYVPPVYTAPGLQELGGVYDVAFSDNNKWLAAVTEGGSTRIWDLNYSDIFSKSITLDDHLARCNAIDVPNGEKVSFTSDSKWMLTSGDCEFDHMWYMGLLHKQIINPDKSCSIPISSIGNWIMPDENVFSRKDPFATWFWDLKSLTPEMFCHFSVERDIKNDLDIITISSDDHWLAGGSNQGKIWLWNLQDKSTDPIIIKGHNGPIDAITFSNNNQWIVTGSTDDKEVKIWNMKLNNLATQNVSNFTSFSDLIITFSPDGNWLATAEDSLIFLRLINSLNNPPIILRGHEDGIVELAFSPDKQWLASASLDNTARLWNINSIASEPESLVLAHNDRVLGIKFSSDGRWLATGSYDKTVRLWHIQLKDLAELACQTAGRNLTQAEWALYFPGEQYHKTCAQWPEGQ